MCTCFIDTIPRSKPHENAACEFQRIRVCNRRITLREKHSTRYYHNRNRTKLNACVFHVCTCKVGRESSASARTIKNYAGTVWIGWDCTQKFGEFTKALVDQKTCRHYGPITCQSKARYTHDRSVVRDTKMKPTPHVFRCLRSTCLAAAFKRLNLKFLYSEGRSHYRKHTIKSIAWGEETQKSQYRFG
jgi:hypothetical protein